MPPEKGVAESLAYTTNGSLQECQHTRDEDVEDKPAALKNSLENRFLINSLADVCRYFTVLTVS